jgi:iron(III) transport system substrate-binding protein
MSSPSGLRKFMQAFAFWGMLAFIPSAALAQADTASLQGPDRTQKLVEGAKKEGTLTIYTSATVDDMKALTTAFEKKYGVKTSVWRASSEDIVQRAATEARGNRFAVDVFETDGVYMEAISREKLLQPVKTPYLADLIPDAIPKHGEWIGDRVQIFVAAYNTGRIKSTDVPKTYADLTDPKWKGKLGIETGDYDWFSTVVTDMGEDKGVKLFRDIVAKNGVSVRKGHTLLTNLVVSGEVPLSLTNYLYKVAQLKNQGAPIDWLALPPQVARAQGTGVARKAPHPYAAVLFVDFLLSDGQAILAKRDFIPTNLKVKPLPAGMTLKFVDVGKMLDESAKWEKLFNDIFARQAR